jgi:chromosome segregation ATPase
MAPPSSDSLTSLHALQDAARKHSNQAPEISLPERPRNVQNDSPYFDAAIAVVGVYTAHLYSEHGSWSMETKAMRQDIKSVDGKIEKVDHKVERFEHGAKEALTELSDRLDDVEEDLKELRKEVKDVQSQVKDVQSQVKDVQSQVKDVQSQVKDVQSQVKDVQSQVESLQRGIENGSARQINALRNHLRDSIEPIYAPVGDY